MRTTIAVETATRDALAAIATTRGVSSIDEALKALIWEDDCRTSMARLAADPVALADYHAESQMLAEVGLEIIE